MHDFYNNSVDVNIFEDPHTFDILKVKLVNLESLSDGGTLDVNNDFSGTDSDYTIRDHYNTCKNNRVIGSFKAKKYIFPRVDRKHPGFFEGSHSHRELLEHFMTTSCGILNTNQHHFYNKLAGRDVKVKEISKLGIPNTVYDIRHEKKKYALKHPSEAKKEKKKVLMCSTGSSQEETEKLNSLHLEYSENKSRVFAKIDKCLEEQGFVSKHKHKQFKKFKRFQEMAFERSSDIPPPKLKYFLRQTLSLFNGPQRLNVLKVNITEKPGSPHIYGIPDMNNVEQAPIVTMLVDTGSDICLISEQMLHHLGIDSSRILPSVSYSIQSSSDLVPNATIGRITIPMHLVSKSGALVRVRIPFIVAHNKLELGKIILGDTFLTKQAIGIQYGGPGRPKVNGEFYTDVGPRKVTLRVKGDTIGCKLKIYSNQIEFTPDAVILDSQYTIQKSDKIKSLNIPSRLALPHQIGIGVTTDGRPFLTNADKFLVPCDIEKDDKQHNIKLCPDYTRCDCPPKDEYPDDKPHESEDVFAHTDDTVGLLDSKTEAMTSTPFPDTTSLNILPHMEIKSRMQKERGDDSVGLLGDKTEAMNSKPFPDTTSMNKHPHMEMKSNMKQKVKGVSNYSTEVKTHTVQDGDMDSTLDDCFSKAQTSAEETKNKHINIINTIEEAGACLPLLEVEQIDYCTKEEADDVTVDTDQTVFRPPPLTSHMTKIERIKINEIKPEICTYCKKDNCACLNKCFSNCTSHFNHCVCYTSCQECDADASDCACIIKCEYCHIDVEKKTFIAQGANCDCVLVAATSIAERLADNHVSISQQDDISSMVQDRMDKYDLHPTPAGTEIDTSHIDTTTARELRLLEKKYESSFASHSLDCGEYVGFSVDLVMDEKGSHMEKERPMDAHVKEEIRETMVALEAQGIVGPALEHGRFQSNIHAVAKPTPGKVLSGKAEAHIDKLSGVKGNKSRLCIDFRGPNRWLEDCQKLSLPSYKDLQKTFRHKIISCIDLCSMFFAIKIKPGSQKFTNFWYNSRLLSFKRLIMGLKSSTFIAMSAARNTYSQENFLTFLRMKGISPGSKECPIQNVDECILLYIDDIAVFTPQNVKDASKLHLLILEFVFFATGMLGFKMKKSKINLMCDTFKFLGHQFNTGDVSTQIPVDKAEAFSKLRAPLSCAEAISRLGALAYFSSYIPLLRTIAAPIQTMAQSGEFFWGPQESLAWETLKLLCSLKFTNMTPLPDRPLFLAVDSSQISTGYLIFQIDDDGQERLIYTGSKMFNAPDRNRPAGARELLGMIFSLVENEGMLRNHADQVIVLTDCISLQSLQRLKSTVPRMLEASMFISTFTNLGIYYTPGVHLYFADLVSRSYNNVFLSRPDEISAEWSKVLPPLDRKKYPGAVIKPSQLTDFILHNPTREMVDCFSKGDLYRQNIFRYHTMSVKDMLQETVTKELSFLASLYSGWNAEHMTHEQFQEALAKLKQFPAGALTKKLSNPNLSVLRNKLHCLGMDKLLIAVLRRKYIPDKTTEDRSIKEEMDLLNIPNIMQERIEKCLKSQNKNSNDTVSSTNRKKLYSTELVPDSDMDSDDEDAGIRVFAPEGQHAEHENRSSSAKKGRESKGKHSPAQKHDERGHKNTAGAIFQANDSQNEIIQAKRPSVNDISYECLKDLSHEEICDILNVNKEALMGQLQSIEPHVRKIISQLPLEGFGISQSQDWSESQLMKMLIILMDIVNSVSNENRSILKVGFYEENDNFKLQFLEDKIAVTTTQEIEVEPFSIISVPLKIGLNSTNEMHFEQEGKLEQLIAETEAYKPGIQTFKYMDIQNLSNFKLTIPSSTIIGHFIPLSLKKYNITPVQMSKDEFFRLTGKKATALMKEARRDISDKIADMLQRCNLDMTKSTAQEAHVMATKLCRMAKLPTDSVPSHPSGQISFDKGNLLSNLNGILLGQYLFKNKLNIDIQVLAEIQAKDDAFTKIIANLRKHNHKDTSYILDHENILFKRQRVYNQVIHRLCLPGYLAKQVLTNLHARKFHPSRTTLLQMYNSVFFTPDVEKITKEISNSCVLCMLNQRLRKMTVTGSKRTDTTMSPGYCWNMDIAYMKRSKSGFKFILVITETMTNYTSLLPLRSIHVNSLIAAVQLFLSIMPKPSMIISDYGSEFSLQFTNFLTSMDIQHKGSMPRRSQQQGTVEKSISIMRAVINRIQATEMKQWPELLPRVQNAINGMHPRGSKFSRTHLLFSPFMTDSPLLGSKYPVVTQGEALQGEYERRANHLHKQSQEKLSNKSSSFVNGQFVVLKTTDKNTASPRQSDIFKVTNVQKDGMAISITNLRTGGSRTVPFSFITGIELDKLTQIDYGIPDLFLRLQKLNYKNRNWSQPGNRKKKINIMEDQTIFGDPPTQEEDDDQPQDQGCSEEDEGAHQHEEDEDEQNVEHDPSQENSDPIQWSHEPEFLPDEETDKQEDTGVPRNRRYGLRPITEKRKYVFGIKTLSPNDYHYNPRKETVNNFRLKPMNEKEQRHFNVHALKTLRANQYDPETEFTECSDEATFNARKRGWRIHFSVCESRPCKECEAWVRVRHARWSPNQREYAECLIEIDKLNVGKRRPRKITFSSEPVKVKTVKRYLKVDAYTLSLATKCCTSMQEILSMPQ